MPASSRKPRAKPAKPANPAVEPQCDEKKKKRRVSAKQIFDARMRGEGKLHAHDMCIPKQSFRRLVQEITSKCKSDIRIQQEALDALQEAVEILIIERFQKCARLAEVCRKDTVYAEHWNYVGEEM